MPSPPENLPHATEPPLSAERCLADFQAELSAGRQPSLEHHLYRTPPEEHGRVFEQLLSAELRFRQNRREPLSAEQYSRRFPQFGAVIPSLVARALEQAGRDSWEEPGPNDTTRVFVPAQSPIHSPVVAPSPAPAGGLENFPRGPSVPQPLLGAVSPALDQRAPTPAARSASEPLPPRVGKYEVRRLLGKGGFGRVYLCYDPDLDDEVAVKVLLTERDPRDLLQTLRDEGRKNRQLHNKGAQVVPVLETGTDQFGSPFMVMKYLSGGTLKDQLVKRGAHPWREAVQLVGDLAKTLKILHADDIYHRDIKPLNILLDDAGRPHLADFGLAARIEVLDTEGSGHSPGYASPEQILYGPSRIDGRSDLYSLGVVFYELLTGKLPIEYQRRLKGDYERRVSDPGVVIPPVRQRNPQVPEAVAALCERCLRWDRNERPQTAADLVEALGRFSDTSTELPSQPSRASHRLAYKAVGGALAVIAVMLFITTLNRAQPSREHLPQASLPESPSRTVSTKLTTPLDRAMRYRTHTLDNPENAPELLPSPETSDLLVLSPSTITYALGEFGNPRVGDDFELQCQVDVIQGTGGLFFGHELWRPENEQNPSRPFSHRFLALRFQRLDEEQFNEGPNPSHITASLSLVTLDRTYLEIGEELGAIKLSGTSPVRVRVAVRSHRINGIFLNEQPIILHNSTSPRKSTLETLSFSKGDYFGVCVLNDGNLRFLSSRILN